MDGEGGAAGGSGGGIGGVGGAGGADGEHALQLTGHEVLISEPYTASSQYGARNAQDSGVPSGAASPVFVASAHADTRVAIQSSARR